MTLPKKVMTIAELVECGFTKNQLVKLTHEKDQKHAFKTLGGGKWLFDTEELSRRLSCTK